MQQQLVSSSTDETMLPVLSLVIAKLLHSEYTNIINTHIVCDKKNSTHSNNVWMAEFLQKFDFSECRPVNSIGSFGFGANLNLTYHRPQTTMSCSHYSRITAIVQTMMLLASDR